ncbi:ribose-5-phosphate isomerase A [Companilactobacillus keshanensis]|uniref:ribose-5-phosphate isomerase n=1 Tax=Companilactobacillus keshanensis TaxID=2486003 RepID=A0ABW4BVK0_9LACO|nr:ribose-5-phosphate isomerase A [Companilactobacillus keshanensis]
MEKLLEEAIKLIQPKMIVSFGGGNTVGRLLHEVADQKLDIIACTPSEVTKNTCLKLGLEIRELSQLDKIDLAFDGCDSLNRNLDALKSNGGIHTYEKIYANLAKDYIILGPKERMQNQLNADIFLSLEVIEPAIDQVTELVKALGGHTKIRQSQDMAGMVRTKLGNCLVDCMFDNWNKIDVINHELSEFNGVVGTSYFHNLITKALLADGEKVISVSANIND